MITFQNTDDTYTLHNSYTASYMAANKLYTFANTKGV